METALGQIIADGATLLPDHFGLVLVYAGCGAVGSITAGCARFLSPFPSMTELLLRGIFGAGTGLICGAGCLAKLGNDANSVWWSMSICGGLGLLGPTFVIEVVKSYLTKKAGNP